MPDQTRKPPKGELSRREFVSTLTATAGFLALRWSPAAAAVEARFPQQGESARRVGISDEAYRSASERAQKLVGQMTLEEKIIQLGAGPRFGAANTAVQRLNLPGYDYYSGEALHGLRIHRTTPVPASSFPVPLALAAAWNPGLARRVYTAISDEARAYDNQHKVGLSYYSPTTLNLHRDPRWGRCEEAPGEDPCLAATIAVEIVRGMQGDSPNYLKTTACSKHFICNNTDDDRTEVSAPVDERSFWEYYTRAYRATILEGDVFTVMGSYNALNGVPTCANRFVLTDLLRRRWGFRGYVTSDCDAVHNIYDPHHYAASEPIAAAMAVLAGCNLDCGGTLQRNLKVAVDMELISEDDIGAAAAGVLTVRYLLGLFDPPERVPYTQIPFEVVDSHAHRSLALEAARQSLVLLKNDSQFLPLDKTALKQVAVIGPLAANCHLGGYSGTPGVRISPYQGIAEHLGAAEYFPYILADKATATSADSHIGYFMDGEQYVALTSNGGWAEYSNIDFSGKTELQVRLSGRADAGRLEVHLDKLDGLLACTLTVPHPAHGKNWFDVSAPLTEIAGEHTIFLSFRGGGTAPLNVQRLQLDPASPPPVQPDCPQVVFKPGCAVVGEKDETLFGEAVEAARHADVVILVCGVNYEVNREARDRQTIELTGAQPELVQAVYGANPKTVLVLSTNNTVAINWAQEHLPAILCAMCAGQAQGKAIAEVLFGDYNPGGKLPCTWYRSLDQLPPFHDYELSKGRTYLYFEGEPLYSFGHGLSYTTFQLNHLQMDATTLGPDKTINISLKVTNTGKCAGTEVVQLYVTPPTSPVKRPHKQLIGFQRVELQPGERKTVVFELPYTEQALWYWKEDAGRFVLQPGTAKILVGNSSANPTLSRELTLEASDKTQIEPDALSSTAVKSSVS